MEDIRGKNRFLVCAAERVWGEEQQADGAEGEGQNGENIGTILGRCEHNSLSPI